MSGDAVAPGVEALPDDQIAPGNYYAEGSYPTTDVARGVMRNRSGARICALSEDFLRGFRKAIIDECGPAADAVFKSCGRRWGTDFAHRFEQELSDFYGRSLRDFSMAMFQVCLMELFSHHGWGRLHLDLSHYDQGLLVIDLHEAVMAGLVDTAEFPVDAMTAGVLAGFFQYLTEEDLDCVQIACRACGAACSRFVIGLRSRLAPAEGWLKAGRDAEAILTELVTTRVEPS